MPGIILGILVGLLFALIIGVVGYVIYECVPYGKSEGICKVLTIGLCITAIITSISMIHDYDKKLYIQRIEKYKITKETIESSIASEELTGYERVQLVNTTIAENKELIGLQYDCQQWYGFAIDDSVMELEPIKFK